jgi:chromosome segregation ATPase
MEITIKTAEEFWRDKVSIQISGTADEVQTVGQHLVRGRQAGYWADACERAEARVRELEERNSDLAGQLATAQEAREIETKRAEGLALTVRGYDQDRHTERDRADRAQARVAELEASLARYVKGHVCTERCTKDAHVAFEGRSLVADLETALADAQTRIGELDGQLRRALAEKERRFTTAQVEDAKAGAKEDARAAMQREIVNPLQSKVDDITRAVLGEELKNEITTYRDSSAAMLMVEALTEVRRITGVTSV